MSFRSLTQFAIGNFGGSDMYPRLLGGLSVAAYLLLMAGANLPNSVQPIYSEMLGLTPFTQSALFSLYIGTLTVTLIVLSCIRNPVSIVSLLISGVAASILANLAMLCAADHFTWLAVARVLSGLALGLGTGAAASLALKTLGERARTTVASGAVLGSLLGNAGAGALATFLPAPIVLVFLIHSVLSAVVLVAVLRLTTKWSSRTHTCTDDELSDYPVPPSPYRSRHNTAAYLLGGATWIASGVVLALTPSVVRASIVDASLIVAILPASIMLGVGALSQRVCAPRISDLRAWHLIIPLVCGLTVFAVAITQHSVPLLFIAGAITGLGQGPAYSLGLATVTHSATPERQHVLTSRYAAVAYGMCALGVTAIGITATVFSVAFALFVASLLTALIGCIAVIAAGSRQRV